MKPKLLIIDPHPFGTIVDTLKWCEYASRVFDVTVVCFDSGVSPADDSIKLKKVKNTGSRAVKGARFMLHAIKEIAGFKGAVFIEYFPHCDVLKSLFPRKRMHVDFRTLSISAVESDRNAYDSALFKACRRFDSVSTLSKGLIENVPLSDVRYLPLGADVISPAEKIYDESLRLLYVGTFNNRDLHKTIEGLAIFIASHPGVTVHYDIVGTGLDEAVKSVVRAVGKAGLQDTVTLHGRIPHYGLAPFYEKANIGVCFVPMKDYYKYQPPTKTFEYIRSGLYCIATDTPENRSIVSPRTGCLIMDTPDDFAKALEKYLEVRPQLSFAEISGSLDEHSWGNIVEKYFIPIVNNLTDGHTT